MRFLYKALNQLVAKNAFCDDNNPCRKTVTNNDIFLHLLSVFHKVLSQVNSPATTCRADSYKNKKAFAYHKGLGERKTRLELATQNCAFMRFQSRFSSKSPDISRKNRCYFK